MKAILVDKQDFSLRWAETEKPSPGPGEVRIQVHATACNRADLLQRRGRYPVPQGASPIMGLDASGIIDAIGPGVEGWQIGDPVCALLAGGGYAQFVTSPASLLFPVPDHLSLPEAAAIPEIYITAFLNLFLEAELQPRESVLVHAGASGVGTAAIQLCRAFNSPVFATASQTKLEFLEKLGVAAAIDRENDDFSARVHELTDQEGTDVILDPVGADYLQRNIHLLRPRGRLVLIGLLGGSHTEISLARVLMRRLRIIGSVLRSRSLAEKTQIADAFRQKVWPLFQAGQLQPVIDQILPIQEVEKAHGLMAANKTIGKVVLLVDDSVR